MHHLINIFSVWFQKVYDEGMTAKQTALQRLFADRSLGAPENAFGFVLWRITSRYQREMDRALLNLDLSNLQFVTLALVGWMQRSGASVTQIELSRFSGIHPMQLSQMLKILESKKFVERRRDPADSRAKRVILTQAGFTVLAKALPLAVQVQSRLFGKTGAKGSPLLAAILQLDKRVSDASGIETLPTKESAPEEHLSD